MLLIVQQNLFAGIVYKKFIKNSMKSMQTDVRA